MNIFDLCSFACGDFILFADFLDPLGCVCLFFLLLIWGVGKAATSAVEALSKSETASDIAGEVAKSWLEKWLEDWFGK